MKLEQSFEVAAPLDRVWAALIDVERVAPCLPGADISGRNDDGSYTGTFRVKIGPTAAAYVGKLEMEKVDETGHTTTMQANGTDRRGQGGAKATIFSAIKEAGPQATVVEVITEYHITGRLARFGRGGMIEEIGNRLLREFATSLQEMLAAPAEEGAYETFVGMSAVKPDAAEAPAAESSESPVAESPASESRTKEPAGEEKPKRRARRDLAAAADAVAAASQPSGVEPAAAAEPPAAGAEPPAPAAEPSEAVAEPPEAVAEPPEAAPEPEAVQTAAEDELAAVVPEASEESEPPLPPAPPGPPEPPAPPEPPPAPEPPPPPPPPAVEAEPLDAVALGRTVILDRIKSNPAPLIGILLLFLLLLRRRRRRS